LFVVRRKFAPFHISSFCGGGFLHLILKRTLIAPKYMMYKGAFFGQYRPLCSPKKSIKPFG
jgi:hypothetical protein